MLLNIWYINSYINIIHILKRIIILTNTSYKIWFLGTVLSLNGHRRYFCMYHAKHPEAARRPGYYTSSGAFMGFESENDSSDNEDIERVSIYFCIFRQTLAQVGNNVHERFKLKIFINWGSKIKLMQLIWLKIFSFSSSFKFILHF